MPIRILRGVRPPKRSGLARVGLLLAGAAVLALGFSRLDLTPSYSYLEATLLSGPSEGYYHLVAERLAKRAAEQRGRLANRATEGSTENLRRLAAAGADDGRCDAHFALVQDGVPIPAGAKLELVGRLPGAKWCSSSAGRPGDCVASLISRVSPWAWAPRARARLIWRALCSPSRLARLGVRLVAHPIASQLDLVPAARSTSGSS
jgi:hypothetical protein